MKCHLLLLSTLTVIRGISAANTCLENCQARFNINSDGQLNLGFCFVADADIADLAACLDTVGRANVLNLNLAFNQLTALPLELFDQLSNLETLSLNNNQLTTLPLGLFDQLASLETLNLYQNELTLPLGLFDQLASLETLSVQFSQLAALPLGLFDQLASLEALVLNGNQLSTLPSGLFDQLASLRTLNVEVNQLTALPLGLFDQLASLETLSLNNNRLTTLPSGLFDQLANLETLFINGNDDLECLPPTRDGVDVTSDPISSDQCGCELTDGTNPCGENACTPGEDGFTCDLPCSGGDALCGDPHMQGLRGQRIDWSGVDGGWYSLIHDADVQLNVRLTAPLPDEFPDRQLMTGVAIMSDGHSLVIEVNNPYDISTDGCPAHVSPCLANGGLRIIVDGGEVDQLLQFSREVLAGDGAFSLSASNLPVECRQFGGDKVWARMFQEMLRGERELADRSSFEEWILSFEHMAAPEWCAKYIDVRGLADLQSTHSIFKIDTSTVTVRLNVGTNFQGGGEQDWDGRALPDLEFWQMDVGLDGLDIESPALSGILGETARPVYDKYGLEIMEGFGAFRGTVEDYRVSDALGTHFTLLQNAETTRK